MAYPGLPLPWLLEADSAAIATILDIHNQAKKERHA